MPSILYLHGFRSSPQSLKARLLGEEMAARGLAAHFHCPALSYDPELAISQAEEILTRQSSCVLVGSSLGGFYATCLAERHALRAVLINPAAAPPRDLEAYIGPQTNLYSGERFEFTETHVAALRAMEVARISPERYWLLVEEGDEVLDYRAAVRRYAGARQTVLPGGDHSFTQFSAYVSKIIEFAGL